jgi:hypothetical protein
MNNLEQRVAALESQIDSIMKVLRFHTDGSIKISEAVMGLLAKVDRIEKFLIISCECDNCKAKANSKPN